MLIFFNGKDFFYVLFIYFRNLESIEFHEKHLWGGEITFSDLVYVYIFIDLYFKTLSFGI